MKRERAEAIVTKPEAEPVITLDQNKCAQNWCLQVQPASRIQTHNNPRFIALTLWPRKYGSRNFRTYHDRLNSSCNQELIISFLKVLTKMHNLALYIISSSNLMFRVFSQSMNEVIIFKSTLKIKNRCMVSTKCEVYLI